METINFDHTTTETSRPYFEERLNDEEILSECERNVFILVNHVILSSLFCLFGIVGNCINIGVFVKQGVDKSTNTSFLSMALSDLVAVLVQMWHNICLNPYLTRTDSTLDLNGTQFLTAGTPSVVFMRITGWITVYITAERCLSIAVPLKIKRIITPNVRVATLVSIYVINIAAAAPCYFWASVGWKFYPAENRTKLGIFFRRDRKDIGVLNSYFHSSMLFTIFLLVVVFTTILVTALVRKSKWRSESVSKKYHKEMRERENRTVVMVIAVAAVLIVCYTPAISCTLATTIYFEFNFSGRQTNLYQAAWSFAFLLHSVNSSITILLYYKTSSKYRQTLQEMLPTCFESEAKIH